MNFPLRHAAVVSSTMDLARKMAAEAGPETEVLIALADSQSAGRGRLSGRAWSGSAGACLLATFGFRASPSGVEAFPLRAGIAAAEALAQSFPGLDLRLKWPNDLLARDGRKLGGILCEAAGGWLFAGIGVNLLGEAYPEELQGKATSVEEALGLSFKEDAGLCSLESRKNLAQKIGIALSGRLWDEGWRKDYIERMWALGESVEFIEGHPDLGCLRSGVVKGVAESGALVLDLGEGGSTAFSSGEICGLRRA
jgi:BirA family biotin operon repressor/biotin-[acetyl-CoA-carboxylase] ligase